MSYNIGKSTKYLYMCILNTRICTLYIIYYIIRLRVYTDDTVYMQIIYNILCEYELYIAIYIYICDVMPAGTIIGKRTCIHVLHHIMYYYVCAEYSTYISHHYCIYIRWLDAFILQVL